MDKPNDLLERACKAKPIAAKLRQIERAGARRSGGPVLFENVTESAQPFVAALIAGKIEKRIWIVCKNVRAQEFFYNEILNWFPNAIFFPEMELASGENATPDPEIAAERLEILGKLTRGGRLLLVAAASSLDDSVPTPESIHRVSIELKKGSQLDREKLVGKLVAAGYESAAQVSYRGQFAVRGGIIDIFSWQHPLPIRIELFDESIESIRQFDLDAQTSVDPLDSTRILLGETNSETCLLSDYVGADDLTIDAGAAYDAAGVRLLEGSEGSQEIEDDSGAFYEHGLGEFEAGDLVVEESKRALLFGQLREWREKDWRIYIFGNNEGEIERLRDLIPEPEFESGHLMLLTGSVSRGFTFPGAGIAVLSDAELFGRYRNARARRISLRHAKEQANRVQIDFSELTEGDFVVHLEHGIGRFQGLQTIPTGEAKDEEVLVLEFADSARLYVPLEQSYLVSRYIGVGKKTPALSALGDGKWAKAKKTAEQAVFDYAARLLSVHAERETSVGFAFAPDNKWQREFERSFIYRETADQVTSIAATKADMESERPMDRLICGDVGFGKTEVAIRAAFKAVMGGKQVAVLTPTTVLAQQHYQTFRERMSDYPVTIDVLSRFRTAAEQRKTIAGLRDGSIDIVIGTHRLISKDVQFKDLGLAVIDEEQRFGVLHKEKFKTLFRLVDILTLSATPIPRTLYLSLMGAKDMSVLETPPLNRIPIETMICPYDERTIRDAIRREMQRQGQVYFLHNRIRSIERIHARIAELCPEARIAVGHGQMDEDELESVMRRFVAGEVDVLISTTIIESGLDIPNANTIIIDDANRFGLADLYQLRGRVGRAQHKAYAYLMLPRALMAVGEARKRINAIKQYSSLGAGFKIAMRDLEIRGAGNILGTAQSGHIIAIGFDLYCQLLKQAVGRLKGEKTRPRADIPVRLDFVVGTEVKFAAGGALAGAPAFLPVSYIGQSQTRIQAYRRLAEVNGHEQLDQLRKAWRDRFGRLPEPVENLLLIHEIKLLAVGRKISAVEVRDRKIMLTRGGDFVLVNGKFPRLTSSSPKLDLRELSDLIRSF